MQSMFRLPWCTDNLGASDKMACTAPQPVDISSLKKLKRKRAATPDMLETQNMDVKRQRPTTATPTIYTAVLPASQLPVATPPVALSIDTASAGAQMRAPPPVREEVNQDVEMQDGQLKAGATPDKSLRVKQAVENQLNLQILMKHNELRLIEQELAKCQVALEQLRRCELKPYPGNEGFDYAVSCGKGAAVIPPPGYTRAKYAAPSGVVDGPYTRHYRHWLLSDPQFDPMPVYATSPVEDYGLAGRSTRHAGARKSLAMSTPQRTDSLHGVPIYHAPVSKKDSSTPLVLRRSTDNKLVKLVCNNCNRGNMSSIQGFLNHCRIAHKVVYESHDAAAIDCGRVLDDDEIANLPAETQSMPVSKPIIKHTPSRAASYTAPATTSASVAVHPLNRAELVAIPTKVRKNAKAVKPVRHAQPQQFAATPFKAASGLPKLSALFARRDCGGDLHQAALDARKKPDFMLDEILSPSTMTPGSPALVTPTCSRSMLGNNRMSGKSLGGQRPQQSYFPHDGVQSPNDNLSPNTVDGNPGLVSDAEDDDNASASDEEHHPHAPLGPPLDMRRGCADNMDIDVAVTDGINQHGVVIRRNSMLNADERSVHTVGGSSSKFVAN